MMKFVYFGSFHISADILEDLVKAGLTPVAVVCNPDRPTGRDKIITPPAIKKLILERGWPIKIYQPEKLSAGGGSAFGGEIGEVDLALVMGYPQIIPESILRLPRLGTVGVHPSLLPKYRGPSPIQSVLLAGETETGVTMYMIDKGVDRGPIIASSEWHVASGTSNTELEKQLAKVAAELITKTLPNIETIKPKEQNHAEATFTKKFTSADGEVDFSKDDPLTVYRKIKAFYPEPSVWTRNFPGYEGKRVKLLAAELRDNKIHITTIQVDGKKPVRIL